jgi:hypothetical protein
VAISQTISTDRLWQQIGSFQGVAQWHPMLARVRGTGETAGAVRTAVGKDGQEQVERLVETDPAERYYRYVIESTQMPVTDYVGELRVRDHGTGVSEVEWSSNFIVTAEPSSETVDLVRGFLEAGVHNLAHRYH